MLRCQDCKMTFETSSMLERHQQKFCDMAATPILLGRYKIKELEEMKQKKEMLRKLQDREETALVNKLKATSKEVFVDKDKSGYVARPDSSYRILGNLGNGKNPHDNSYRETSSQIDILNSRNSGGGFSRNVLSEAEMYSSDNWRSDDTLPSRKQTGSYFNVNQLKKQRKLMDEQNAKIQRKLRQIREEKDENDLTFRYIHSPSPPSPPPNGHYAVNSQRRPFNSRFSNGSKKSGIPKWQGYKTPVESDNPNAYQFSGRNGYLSSSSSQKHFNQRRIAEQSKYKRPVAEHRPYQSKYERAYEPIRESYSSDSLDSYAKDSADENVESSSVFNPLPRSKRLSSLTSKPPVPKAKRSGYPYRQFNDHADSRVSRAGQQKQIDEVIKIINDQKSRSETLLEDLKRQIDQIQDTQRRQIQAKADRISSASRDAAFTGYGGYSNSNLRKLKTTNSLVDEIRFMKDDYLHSGGNDRQVLEDMDSLLRDASDLDRDKGGSQFKKNSSSKLADISEQRKMQQMEEENHRLTEELHRLRMGVSRPAHPYQPPESLPYY